MKKIIIISISAVFGVIIILFLAKNMIIKTSVTTGVKAMTGLKLSIRNMDVGIFKTLIGINELRLYNPPGFVDELMADMPEVYVDYDLGSFIKGNVHLEEARIDLRELIVVKNEKGELNLDTLKSIKGEAEEKETEKPEFQIDVLELKIGRVVYKDYSKGDLPKVREFNVNIDERYENVTDPNALANLIIVKALKNTTIARLANFDLGSLQEGVAEKLKGIPGLTQETTDKAMEVGKGIEEKVKGTTKETVEKATDAIKKFLPFGK